MIKKIKLSVDDIKKSIAKWRSRDAEMVSGVFKNLECPGQGVMFNFKAYPGDEFRDWHFIDNERYTIPRGIAIHLNTNCHYKEYKYLNEKFGDENIQGGYSDGRLRQNGANMTVTRKVNRFAFHSLEFTRDDLDMVPSNLLEVSIDSPTQLQPIG